MLVKTTILQFFCCFSLFAAPTLNEFLGRYQCAGVSRSKPKPGAFTQVEIRVSSVGKDKVRLKWKEGGTQRNEVIGPLKATSNAFQYLKTESPTVYREVESASLSKLANTHFLEFNLNRKHSEVAASYCTKKK